MDSSSWAGLITAVATVVTAAGGLVLALSVLIPILRTSKRTAETLTVVHTIVNQQRTDGQRYAVAQRQHARALEALLKRANIEFPLPPIDQSLPVVGEDDAQPGQPT